MKTLTTIQEVKKAINANPKIMIKFYSPTCGHCTAIKSFYASLDKKYPKVIFCEINVSDNSDLAKEYGVKYVPTFIYVEKMKTQGVVSGDNKEDIIKLLE